MDIYDKSRTFLEEILKRNESKISNLLNKQDELHLQFNIPIKKVPEGLAGMIPWLNKDEILGHCYYYVDIFKENGEIQYKIEKLNKGNSTSAIKVITRRFIEVDNRYMPSKNKVESDLECIMNEISTEFQKYLANKFFRPIGEN